MSNNLWGGRFIKPLDPRVMKFNSSLSFDNILYKYDIIGSQAHVKMLSKQGLIMEGEAKIICDALMEIEIEIKQGMYSFKEYEDIHTFIEQLLIQKIGDLGKKLHTGRSRNDQVALDLKLYMRDISIKINDLLNALIDTLTQLMHQYKGNIIPGYTHLQRAQPITLDKYFGAYVAMFKRDLDRVSDWRQRMNFSPLGAGALAGSSLPLDRQNVADELGFDGIVENTLDAVSDRDYVIEFTATASIIMVHLSRLSEDLIIWATQEFNFITIDDAFATGSSLMPNKKNPDILELIRGKSGRIFGNLISILTVMKGLPLAYNKDMQEDKECIFDTVNTLISCLKIISPFLLNIKFNNEIMEKSANFGYLNATYIVERLVLNGMSFRDAHHQVGMWILESIEKGVPLDQFINE